MTAIVTPDQVRAAEQQAIDDGRSVAELMRDAAEQIAGWIDQNISVSSGRTRRVTALVGPGNNGGDALVALAILIEQGWQCRALLIGRSQLGDLPAAESSLDQIELIDSSTDTSTSDVILDGIYGTGGHAKIDRDALAAMTVARDARHRRQVPLVAIDAPTGVDSGTGDAHGDAFPADVTLCIGFPKVGLLNEPAATMAGELVVLDIGLEPPPSFDGPYMIDADDVREKLPRRDATAHKDSAGGLLVVGGAPTYYGAPRLSAEAGLRAGAGLVALSIPRSIIPAIASEIPEAIYHPMNDGDARRSVRAIRDMLEADDSRYMAIVVGPGIGRDEITDTLLTGLFGGSVTAASGVGFHLPGPGVIRQETSQAPGSPAIRQPIVLDADALNWLADRDNWQDLVRGLTAVLTPHPGEMARLLGSATAVGDVLKDRFAVARSAATEWGQIVVLKGGYTVVALPDGSVWVAPRATSELATAGTGDVLAGLIGGLLAQGLDPADAARSAIYLGSMAGKRASDDLGTLSVVARDVIQYLPWVMHDLLSPRWKR